MNDLNRRALFGILRTFAMLVVVVFGPVWTLRYWQGWACLAAFFIPAGAITVHVARNDPALLERRLKAGAKAEKERGQKIVQSITAVVFLADFAVPAFVGSGIRLGCRGLDDGAWILGCVRRVQHEHVHVGHHRGG